jgi:hypothetical protein
VVAQQKNRIARGFAARKNFLNRSSVKQTVGLCSDPIDLNVIQKHNMGSGY